MGEKEYLVSVITPFHNTKIEFFKRGYDSLKRQTLGFKNIEWVVVVHNSDDSYADAVQKLTKEDGNVKIYILNNDKRTPSSPRNYALTKAQGKYIAFLDSDDFFTDDGLKEVVEGMEETEADIASFRAETLPEDETVIQAIDTRARFDQTVHMLEFKKGDEKLNDLIYAGGLTIWSKLIRRDFLSKYNIGFSLDMKYGEDVCFSMECLGKAKKIIILPQTIVYVYFMNHGSLAQDMNHTPESLLKLASDFANIFDVTVKGGFKLEKLAWPVLGYLAEMMAITPGLDDEFRKRIYDLMHKYFGILGPLEPDAKFFNAQMAEHFMKRARMIILGEEDNDEMAKSSLLPILLANADTEYGQRYGFGSIHKVVDYQKKVPLSDYSMYRPLIKLMTRIGESNLICKEKVVAYSSKLCPDGGEFLVPQTAPFVSVYQNVLIEELKAARYSTFLAIESAGESGTIRFNDGALLHSVADTVLAGIRKSDIYNSHARSTENKYGTITAPESVLFKNPGEDLRYAKLLFALADPDVSQIIVPFTVNILDMVRFLKCMWEMLVEDIASGRVSEVSGLAEGRRKELSKLLKPSKRRAKELRTIFEQGFENVLPKIWKNLDLIISAGSGENAVYSRQIMKYIGSVPLDYGYLGIAEGIIGKVSAPGENTYIIMEKDSFLEFLPEDSDKDKTFIASELEISKHYEVIISNMAGLYRYRSGIIVEATKIQDGQTYVRYCYDRKDVVTVSGVSINTLSLRQAGKKIDEEAGMITYDYCLFANDKKNCFELFLKPEKEGNYSAKLVQEIAEKELSKVIPSYGRARKAGKIDKIRIHFLPSADADIVKGKAPKPIRIIHASSDEKLFKTYRLYEV